jgi:hypothetical protein
LAKTTASDRPLNFFSTGMSHTQTLQLLTPEGTREVSLLFLENGSCRTISRKRFLEIIRRTCSHDVLLFLSTKHNSVVFLLKNE